MLQSSTIARCYTSTVGLHLPSDEHEVRLQRHVTWCQRGSHRRSIDQLCAKVETAACLFFGSGEAASLCIDVQRQHDHEEPRRKIGTARCARAGQPTTRSKWQCESVASSSVAIESRAGDRHDREPTTALAVPGWGCIAGYQGTSALRLCPRGDPQNHKAPVKNSPPTNHILKCGTKALHD